MKRLLIVLACICVCNLSNAQFELYKEVDGVQFYTKWGHEKWLSRKSPKVLMVKIVNTGNSAVDFELGVEFFKTLIMVEEAKATAYCLSGGKTLLPRMAGLVFKPEEVKPEEIDSFELTGLEISKRPAKDCSAVKTR